MSRVTKRIYLPDGSWTYEFDETKMASEPTIENKYNRLLVELGEYEYLEDSGILLRLPCPIGYPVYCLNDIFCKHRLEQSCCDCLESQCSLNDCFEPDLTIDEHPFSLDMLDGINEWVFLSYEKARKKLKRKGYILEE